MASQDGESSGDFGMRIGKNFQAEIPDLIKDPSLDANLTRQMASLMWSPNPLCLDAKVDFYIEHATTKFNYSQEQALGLLLWHHHNVDVAISDLCNFAQTPDDWTTEDKILFEQALGRFGKSFNKIHELMPDKSVGSLVKYYYSWKKSKKPRCPSSRSFVMQQEDSKGSYDSEHQHCQEFAEHKTRTDSWIRVRTKSRTPHDLYLDSKELRLIARGYSDHTTRQLESKLNNYKDKIAANKDVLEAMKSDLSAGINQFRKVEVNHEVNAKWTNTELLLAMQGLRYFGKDFQSVSEMLSSKSEHLVRNLYFNHKAKCSLDSDDQKDMKQKVQEDCKANQLDAPRTTTASSMNKSFQGHKSSLQHSAQIFYKVLRRGPVSVLKVQEVAPELQPQSLQTRNKVVSDFS